VNAFTRTCMRPDAPLRRHARRHAHLFDLETLLERKIKLNWH